jgi:hypothetical protein
MLNEMPQDLGEIYSRIIRGSSPRARSLTGLVLAFVVTARQPLIPQFLQEMMKTLPRDAMGRFGSVTAPYREDVEKFIKRVLAAAGGLVEVVPAGAWIIRRDLPSKCFIVCLAHRTVKTYLETEGGWAVLTTDGSREAVSETLWMYACTAMIGANMKYITKALRMRGGLKYPTMDVAIDRGVGMPFLGRKLGIPTRLHSPSWT